MLQDKFPQLHSHFHANPMKKVRSNPSGQQHHHQGKQLSPAVDKSMGCKIVGDSTNIYTLGFETLVQPPNLQTP